MPRLEGARSNSSVHIAMVFLLAVVLLWLLEYYGLIDFINGFGAPGLTR